jgi:LuxR family transcriptional regulator, maltose regulon positive regulatory protein
MTYCPVADAGSTLDHPKRRRSLSAQSPRREPLGTRKRSTWVAAPDLLVPRPPQPLVLRPRLFDILDRGIGGPLTLVSAPAGFGKTALLSSWLGDRQHGQVAWLSLRPRRGEAAFWAEFLEAVRRVVPRRSLLSRLAPPRVATPAGFVVQLLNGFAELEEPLVIVIDDFHVVHGRGIPDGIEQLLRAAPDAFRLVLSTRHDPLLPVHVLRASGELTELRARDLALTPDEAAELLHGLDVDLEPTDFRIVLDRTEGWAAGLRLLALSRRARGNGASPVTSLAVDERPAVEYLAAEGLAGQPQDVRDFLLSTSVVDRMTSELAEALTDRRDSAQMLERLVNENLFIDRLETSPPWYRYHQLFAELLRVELLHQDRSEVPRLHARAACWYLDQGASLDAVHHALAAGDIEVLTMCMVDSWFELLTQTDGALLDEFLDQVATNQLDASPELGAIAASTEFLKGEVRRGVGRLRTATASWPDSPPPRAQAILNFGELLRARLEGSFSRAVLLAERLLELARSEPLPAQSAEALCAIALAELGVAELHLGRYERARLHLEGALQISRQVDVPYGELSSIAALAWAEHEQGRLRRSARLARSAIDFADTRGWDESFKTTLALAALALVEYEWDDLDSASEHVRQLAETARTADDRTARGWAAAIDAVLGLAIGGEAAEIGLQRLRGGRADVAAVDSPPLREFAARIEPRLLAATGDIDEAQGLAARSLREHPSSPGLLATQARIRLMAGDPGGALEALAAPAEVAHPAVAVERAVLRALAHRAAGNEPEALDALEEALTLAEPEGIRRPLVEAGPVLRDLLARHLRRSASHRWFAAELLRRLEGNGGNGVVPAELLEPLSPREGEVLRYLPTMMSNADIAAELFVSVNTVKTHVKSIYRKLDATRRPDAVRRARQLHLL